MQTQKHCKILQRSVFGDYSRYRYEYGQRHRREGLFVNVSVAINRTFGVSSHITLPFPFHVLVLYFQALLLIIGVLSLITLSISIICAHSLFIYSNVAERTPLEEFGLHDVTFSPAVSNVTLLFPINIHHLLKKTVLVGK